MKLAIASLLTAFVASSAFATSGTILVNDTFSGTSLDTSEWQTIAPFSGSGVSVSGGSAISTRRGILATKDEITAPYTISGSFRIPSSNGMFSVSLRSNLDTEPNFSGVSGIVVSFVNEFDSVQIHTLTAAGSTTTLVPNFSYAFDSSSSYSFAINDDGANLSLAINGTTMANFSSTFATGTHVAFYSREYSGSTAALESVTITTSAVPEPSSFAALAGLAGLGLAATRRRRAA